MAPKSALHVVAHAARRIVGQAGRVGLDLLVGGPGPLLVAAVDAAADLAVLQLAEDALALPAARVGQRRLDVGRAGEQLRPPREHRRRACNRAPRRGSVLSLSAASFASQSAHSPCGGWLLGRERLHLLRRRVQVQVPSQPGPIAGALDVAQSCAYCSRHGSHIDDAGSDGSAAPRPPSFAPLADAQRDPGARTPRHRAGGRFRAQPIR